MKSTKQMHAEDPYLSSLPAKRKFVTSSTASSSSTSSSRHEAVHSGNQVSDLLVTSKKRRTVHDSQPLTDKMTNVASPIPIHRSRFQPHPGVKRLTIKNLRQDAEPDLGLYYDRLFAQVKEALRDVLGGRNLRKPLERLYRDVEEVCKHKQAEQLYNQVKEDCQSYLREAPLQSIKNHLATSNAVEIASVVLGCWRDWASKIASIRSIFSFLDRSFLLNSKIHPQLNDMAISLFREVIFGDKQIAAQAYAGLCELVQIDRLGRSGFDPTLLKDSISMLHVMDLYKIGLEPSLLQQSKTYFAELATMRANQDLQAYMSRCVVLLQREGTRCDSFNFDSATKRQIIACAHSTLIKQRTATILNPAAVGTLLESNDIDTLRSLYELLSFSKIQTDLIVPWEVYIRQAGSAVVREPEKSDEMVVRLLELKRALDLVIRDAFAKDDAFKFAMREAFSNFINDRKNTAALGSASLVGEVIAKYIDMLLRGGLKAVPRSLASDVTDRTDAEKAGQASTGDEDAELDRQLEQGLELFRFIEGKDVFEAFYKKDLARRILMGRSASQDAERNMLTKLKGECGSNFTHNLEQMFRDTQLSRDEMISYMQSLSNTSKTTLALSVTVLQQAAWPTYPDINVNLPEEVARHIEKFDRHYKHNHTGRKLYWKHALAHSIVRAQFNKGAKELVVSGFQAIILVLFNALTPDGHLLYTDIRSASGLVDVELKRTLQSLACTKTRILNKHPKGREVNDTDTFTVNLAFTDPKFRVKINQIQLKETKEENKETHERVNADRQYETQAALVRIMKSRKKMTHANLVAECIEQTKSRGAVEIGEIKKNIEKLIEKDYLERDGNSYEYLA